MNFIVNSQEFAAELRLVNKVVPTKPAIPILNHVLIDASGNTITMYGTDLEVGLTTHCTGSVNEPGRVALPVSRLLAMIEQFPDADVSIEVVKQQAVIKCGAFASKLQTSHVEDFPEPAEVDGAMYALDGAALSSLIAKTRHAIAANATKYTLRGALLKTKGTTLALVATDGKRLALATTGRPEGLDFFVVVPNKTLDALAGQAEDLELTVGDRHLFFRSNNRLLTSRKLEGKFPAYEKIIPLDNDKVMTFDRAALTAALKRVTLIAEENGAVYFIIKDDHVTLSASSAGIGSAVEAVNVAYTGDELKVCLDGKYVIDFLESSTNNDVTMALKDDKSSAMLTDGSDHVGVISTMRTK